MTTVPNPARALPLEPAGGPRPKALATLLTPLALTGDAPVGERYKEAVRDKKYSTLSPQEGVIREEG